MDHQRLGIAAVGQQAKQLHRADELLPRLIAATNAERYKRAGAVWHIFLRALIVLAGRQSRIVHPLDVRMPRQILRHLQSVLGMPLHSEMKSFHALEKEERVEWSQTSSCVAEPLYSCLDDERQRSERLRIRHAVI